MILSGTLSVPLTGRDSEVFVPPSFLCIQYTKIDKKARAKIDKIYKNDLLTMTIIGNIYENRSMDNRYQ